MIAASYSETGAMGDGEVNIALSASHVRIQQCAGDDCPFERDEV